MNLDDLRKANLERLPLLHSKTQKWTEMEWACAAAGEMGELCNAVKKARRDRASNEEEIGEEIADVIIYLDIIASFRGLKLVDLIRYKFNKTSLKHKCQIML